MSESLRVCATNKRERDVLVVVALALELDACCRILDAYNTNVELVLSHVMEDPG